MPNDTCAYAGCDADAVESVQWTRRGVTRTYCEERARSARDRFPGLTDNG